MERNRPSGQARLFAALPLDPHVLAELLAHERRRRYDALDLDDLQHQAAEQAVRLVIADQYRTAA